MRHIRKAFVFAFIYVVAKCCVPICNWFIEKKPTIIE